MGITVKIEGLDQLQKNLERLPHNIAQRIIKGTLNEAARDMISACAEEAPKDSGFLSEHFVSKTTVTRDELAATTIVGPASRVEYPRRVPKRGGKGSTVKVASVARFWEYGTHKLAANPFMSRAFMRVREGLLNKIIAGIRSALEER